MSEHVIPLKDFPDAAQQTHIGETLHTLVKRKNVAEHLRERHLLGVLRRHGEEAKGGISAQNIYKAYKLHNELELGVFVLNSYEYTPMGLATVDPFAGLRYQPFARKRLPFTELTQPIILPPGLARGPLQKTVSVPGPQVCAWVAPGFGQEGLEILTQGYTALADPNGIARSFYELASTETEDDVRAWTIEPQQSPDWIRTALSRSGFRRIGEPRYFDDGESRRLPPPAASYYEVTAS